MSPCLLNLKSLYLNIFTIVFHIKTNRKTTHVLITHAFKDAFKLTTVYKYVYTSLHI